jgi:uncharacterized coiled-coil DUF342 family protein
MNIEEYHERISKTHSVTGIPSYWEDLQAMTAERDKLKALAEELHMRAMLQVKSNEKCADIVDELTEERDLWKRGAIHLVEIEDCNKTNCELCEEIFSAYEKATRV